MAVRWVICPVIGDGKTTPRRPLVADMADPGRPIPPVAPPDEPAAPFKTYCYTAAISDGLPGQINDWCLAQVWGVDFAPLDADQLVAHLRPGARNVLDRARHDAQAEGHAAVTEQIEGESHVTTCP